MRIAVVGAGSWGTTIASSLAERADTVLWAREPEVAEAVSERHENPLFLPGFTLARTLRATDALDEAAEDAELVVIAVPVQHMRGVTERLFRLVGPDTPLLSLSKGIEQGTLMRPSQILSQGFADRDPALIGVLSGPNLAREVMAGQPSATVVAFPDEGLALRMQSLLTSDHFRVYTSRDVVGCEIGGAVKNVIAIAAGMTDGLGYGWNSRAGLITRGLAELTRLGVALGGEPLTFLGLAGNGDLIATCSSPESRNRRVGVELGKGRELRDVLADMKMVAEGVTTTPAVLTLAANNGVEMPMADQVENVLAGVHTAPEVVAALMGRQPTSELHDLPNPSRP